MSTPQRRRILAFERLERKASPCALLLHVVDTEDGVAAEPHREVGQDWDWAVSHWQHQISTSDLLRFVQENTSEATQARAVQTPSRTDSEAADEMMKLQDTQLRSMIVFAAMELDATSSTQE